MACLSGSVTSTHLFTVINHVWQLVIQVKDTSISKALESVYDDVRALWLQTEQSDNLYNGSVDEQAGRVALV